jgi:hypothetical protein
MTAPGRVSWFDGCTYWPGAESKNGNNMDKILMVTLLFRNVAPTDSHILILWIWQLAASSCSCLWRSHSLFWMLAGKSRDVLGGESASKFTISSRLQSLTRYSSSATKIILTPWMVNKYFQMDDKCSVHLRWRDHSIMWSEGFIANADFFSILNSATSVQHRCK